MPSMFDRDGPIDPKANDGPLLRSACIAVVALSGVAVCLRFVSRKLVKQPLLWDDWMILIALPCAWACCFLTIAGIDNAQVGQHFKAITPEHILLFFKLLYALNIVYALPIIFIKYSIICFYRRVFAVPQTKKPLIALAAIVTAWGIAVIIVAIFSCSPVDGFWLRLKPGVKCINTLRYYLGVAIPNIITDIALLAFPLPFLWKLKVTTSQRVALCGIFILGGFVTLVSILRLVALVQSNEEPDFTWALVPVNLWTEIETNIGIVLACLPSMLPLLRLLMGKKAVSTSAASSKQWSDPHGKNKWRTNKSDFDRLHEPTQQFGSNAHVSYGKAVRHDAWELQ